MSNLKTRALLDSLKFIELIKQDLGIAVKFAQENLSHYMDKQITFVTQDRHGNQRQMHVSQVTCLICFDQKDLQNGNNDFNFLVSSP